MAELCDYPTEELVEELEKRGIEVQPLIEHHEKYLEIDGEDKTIWVTRKKHIEIHRKWHEQGRIIPKWVIIASTKRTKAKRYNERHKKNRWKKFKKNSPILYQKRMIAQREYSKKYYRMLNFYTGLGENTSLREVINYNIKTGVVSVSSYFMTPRGKLPIIDI